MTDRHVSTLADYLGVLRRRKWVIVLSAVLVPLVAAVYAKNEKAVYEASATVLLSNQDIAAALTNNQPTAISGDPARIAQTQAQLARVPEVAHRVVTRLHLRMTADDFLGASSVSASPTADILTFSARAGDRRLAARMAASYARQYTFYRHQLDTLALENARREVASRIGTLQVKKLTSGPLYTNLVEREQQLKTLEALQTSHATVVTTPVTAGQISPQPTRDAILGFLLGIGLGVGLAFLLETLDTRVRNGREIAELLGLPLLARLPEPPKKLRLSNQLVMLSEPGGPHSEPFRMLRTNLEFAMLERRAGTIMVTSAVEREGKSTTAGNLAVALARAGERVILIDLDLRRPYLDRFFDLRGRPGVTQVVLGRAALADCLARIPLAPIAANANGSAPAPARGALAVLGCGPIPPDPGEFVASDTLSEVLGELRDLADIVLIDAPPLLHVGDALTLSAKVDAAIIVARRGIRRPLLAETNRLIASMPAAKLGFVLTHADPRETYGYSYGYGYAPVAVKQEEELFR